MRGLAIGTEPYFAAYESALSTVDALGKHYGAKVIYLAPPPMDSTGQEASDQVIMKWAASVMKESYRPRNAVSNEGAFTLYLPCLQSETDNAECVDGQIPVRELDTKEHVHFCPYWQDVSTKFTCTIYSSGEHRWAAAVDSLIP
jgi:hypothetical protein